MMRGWTGAAAGATGFRVASKGKDEAEPKRLNRAVGVSDALKGVLDSALKKRGFATRDLLANWTAMAPKPYDGLAVPDQLKWPRGAGHEGATLYLRCAPGHALAIAHEGALIAAAVNRYFGYYLVREVKLSAEPFTAASPKPAAPRGPSPEAKASASRAVAAVDDPGLKEALAGLGEALLSRKRQG
jgi:hypothetical protein